MKFEVLPSMEELEKHAEMIPEINPSSTLAMLSIMQASEKIRSDVNDVLEEQYQLSEGKLRVLIVLHQHPEGISPSQIAYHTGVTKATISVMVRRMIRDSLVHVADDQADGRSKKIILTEMGKEFMNEVLPAHYLRISNIMSKLTMEEQNELIRLLTKVAHA